MYTQSKKTVTASKRPPQSRCASVLLFAATGLVSLSGFNLANADTVTQRIVGGDPYLISVAPSTVALFDPTRSTDPGQSQFCGGTVIADRFVLTAAHCVVSDNNGTTTVKPAAEIQVLANTTKLSEPGSAPVQVIAVTPHPDYIDVQFGNDLALLELATSTGAPITPLDSAPIENGQAAFTAGWGALNEGGEGVQQQFPDTLQGVVVSLVPPAECDQLFPSQQQASGVSLSPDQVCGAVNGGGKDSCQGDSGGPLYRLDDNNVPATLVGVVSFGFGCARAAFPGVYAGVALQTSFINGTINNTPPVVTTDNPPPVDTGNTDPDPDPDLDNLSLLPGDSSGCSIGSGNGSTDPMLPLLLLISIAFMFRRSVSRIRNQVRGSID